VASTRPFIDVKIIEVETGIAYARERHQLIMELDMSRVFSIANSTGRKLHEGMDFPEALKRALRGNLPNSVIVGSGRYKAYRSAVSKIFSNREAVARTAVTELKEAVTQATELSEAIVFEYRTPVQQHFHFV
jgi:TPP-dependent pyruvate/acetoin dehydrogenase alpha subunit